jgi:hypothetical protein
VDSNQLPLVEIAKVRPQPFDRASRPNGTVFEFLSSSEPNPQGSDQGTCRCRVSEEPRFNRRGS